MADLLSLGLIAGFVRGGWSTGFIRRLFGLLFLSVSFVAGAYLRQPVGALIGTVFPDVPDAYRDLVGYGAVFGVLTFGLNVISKAFVSRFAVGGMSRVMDRALGAVLGSVEAVLILSVGIVILHTYVTPGSTIEAIANVAVLPDLLNAVDGSTIGVLLEQTTVPIVLRILGPFLPSDITSFVPAAIPGGLPGFPIPSGLPFPFPSTTP